LLSGQPGKVFGIRVDHALHAKSVEAVERITLGQFPLIDDGFTLRPQQDFGSIPLGERPCRITYRLRLDQVLKL
jgi:hypothetical protein